MSCDGVREYVRLLIEAGDPSREFGSRLLASLDSPAVLSNGLHGFNAMIARYGNEPFDSIDDLRSYDGSEYQKIRDRLLHRLELIRQRVRFVDDSIVVWRALSIGVPDEFIELLRRGRQNVGIYWSYDVRGARPYWGNQSKTTCVLRGRAPIDSIDYDATAAANTSTALSNGEEEITLLKGADVFVDSVTIRGIDTELGIDCIA